MIELLPVGVGILATLVAGYRYSWGCKYGLHRFYEAFPATHFHGECACGKRTIPALRDGRLNAPVDIGWLETGVKTEMGTPPSGKRRDTDLPALPKSLPEWI